MTVICPELSMLTQSTAQLDHMSPPLHTGGRRIAVIGGSYVSLVTGVCLAKTGHTVTWVDPDPHRVDQINAGVSPIFEPGLNDLLRTIPLGRLSAATDVATAIAETDLSLISVETPFDGEQIDVSELDLVCRTIGRGLKTTSTYHVVVVRSTVVPGTTDERIIPILEFESGKRAYVDFGVAVNPEFLRQGQALEDFRCPDRIVIGSGDRRTAEIVAQIFDGFEECPRIITSTKTAETIKCAANALLATLISFTNEIANLCEALQGIDAVDVMRGVHLDKRLSPISAEGERSSPGILRYLEAGCGFGGGHFPKNIKALVAHGKEAGAAMAVLESVLEVNQWQPLRVVAHIQKHFPDLQGVRVSVLGLAVKPGTDDITESPAIPILLELLDLGADVVAFDPVADGTAARVLRGRVTFSRSLSEAVRHADAIAVLTSWPEFAQLPELVATRTPQPVVIDGRRFFAKELFHRYEGIGLHRSAISTDT